ncbi:MAG TPA: multicopper oxidase family protein [Mycobacteriales bacterium]|nr:multicopper oxidase family protein [Mycobacteriales bacterium]
MKDRLRVILPTLVSLAIVVPLVWMWQQSRLPGSYSVMDMGYEDLGGGTAMAAMPGMHHGTSVPELVADPARPADVSLTLTARKERVRLASGEQVDGYTVNGTSPGPVIRAVQGQLVQVKLVNANVPDGITLHWHGVELPNAEDGVAGVTQDAVRPGGSYTYRFVASHAGTFWYHSHQVSHTQVQRGLLGALVITPKAPLATREALALSHVYDGQATVNGHVEKDTVPARPGDKVRVRVINTDNGALRAWASGSAYRLLAVDGYEVHGPTEVTGKTVLVTAGGRADLEVTAPARVELGASTLVVGGEVPGTPQPTESLDLLTYGERAPVGFDPEKPDRRFTYSIGRRPGFYNGRPGLWWSINGHLFPDVPMFVVAEGDVVRMTIRNHSGRAHPMHLHGHHVVVLSRDGVKATGSPWWTDSLDVASGHRYEIAFLADNPGVWMDHCHNLPHAAQGLVAHLMYEGVTTPYRVGHQGNHPE